jgi:hypothetical protein
MKYLIPFAALKNHLRLLSVKGQLKVDMNYDELLEILKRMLLAVEVDEEWYRSNYSDVDDAIKAGAYKTAKQHFIENGYFEGRMPFPLQIDEQWYLGTYDDVKSGVEQGTITSAHDHFLSHGYMEGRLPAPL